MARIKGKKGFTRRRIRGKGKPNRVTTSSLTKIARQLYMKPVDVVRYYTSDLIMSSNNITYGSASISFLLSQVANYTEFTVLFDAYRILKAEVEFVPQSSQLINSNAQNTNAIVGEIPHIYTVIDYDDDNVPTFNSIRQQGNSSHFPVTQRAKRVVNYPRVANSVFDTPLSGYAVGQKGQWINCSYTGIKHYGLKALLEPTNAPTNDIVYNTKMVVRVWIQFRNMR